MSANNIFNLHLASAIFMTGVIWLVQIVQYPLLRSVGQLQPEIFPAIHAMHSRWIGFVVGPAMVFEFFTAGLLCFLPLPQAWPKVLLWVNFTLVAFIWAATFFVSVPLHTKLSTSFHDDWARLLVDTNWIRTLLWSLKTILLLYLLTLGNGR